MQMVQRQMTEKLRKMEDEYTVIKDQLKESQSR